MEGATAASAFTRESCLFSKPEASDFAPTSPGLPQFADWLTTVRELCVASREQRLDGEAILSRLVGDPASNNGPGSKRDRVLVGDDVEDNRDLETALGSLLKTPQPPKTSFEQVNLSDVPRRRRKPVRNRNEPGSPRSARPG
jgi:hypothetical protein